MMIFVTITVVVLGVIVMNSRGSCYRPDLEHIGSRSNREYLFRGDGSGDSCG